MSFLADDKNLIDSAMSTELVSASPEFDKIVEAMRYSALGGKRLRGILTLEFAKMFGCDTLDKLKEMIKTELDKEYQNVITNETANGKITLPVCGYTVLR